MIWFQADGTGVKNRDGSSILSSQKGQGVKVYTYAG
jgi:hypothetical protein